MGISERNRISRSDVQKIIDGLYSWRVDRGLSNNTKPSLNTTKPLASDIAIVVSNISSNGIGINYASSIIPSISSGTKLTSHDILCFQQYWTDLLDLRTCASGCTGSCWQSCSGRGCSSSGCSGNCASGCGNYCTGCSGSWAWGCVANCGFDCSGTGSCKGSCSGSCTNGCNNACVNSCNTICMNECKNSCVNGCRDTSRIGTINNR